MPYLLKTAGWVIVREISYFFAVVECLYYQLIGLAPVGGFSELAYMCFGGGYACANGLY